MDPLLQEMLDEFKLRKLVYSYCRAVDRGDIARTIVTDWAQVNDPSKVDLSHPVTRDTPRGTPDTNDPSYRFFSLLTKGVG